MSAPALRCLVDRARWSRERDSVLFPADGGDGPVVVAVTRAGLAALDRKDRSEISAEQALALFAAHGDLIARIALDAHRRSPAAGITIDYPDIERAL